MDARRTTTSSSADFALLDAAVLPTRVYAPSGDCIYANEAWERLWALPRAAALRYNILRDPLLDERGVLREVRRAFAGERVELPLVTTDPRRGGPPGGPRTLRSHLAPFASTRGTLVIERVEDVTDRIREQEQHAALLRALGDMGHGIFVAEGMRIVWANAAYEEMTGYALAELTSEGFRPEMLNPDEAIDVIQRRMDERAVGLRRLESQERDLLRKDGTRLRVQVRLRTIARGPPPQIVGVIRSA